MIAEIQSRKAMIKKLHDAEKEYAEVLEKAEKEKKEILSHAMDKKEEIIREAQILAQKHQQDTLNQATEKAQKLIEEGERKAQQAEDHLKQTFSDGVKQTSMLIVKKLLQSDKDIQSAYLDTLVQEYKKS